MGIIRELHIEALRGRLSATETRRVDTDLHVASVIVPYNVDRGYLDDALQSVYDQTYDAVELVVVHGDGSLAANFNAGVRESSGVAVMVLAEDDMLMPEAVEKLIPALDTFDFVCANAYLFGATSKHEYRSQVPRNYKVLAEYNSIHGGTVMYRREMLAKVGGMDERMWTAEEYELHMRLLKLGYRLGYVDAFVHRNRIHDGSKSKISDPLERMNRTTFIELVKSRYKA